LILPKKDFCSKINTSRFAFDYQVFGADKVELFFWAVQQRAVLGSEWHETIRLPAKVKP
jgi:hypothetical protein